MASQAKFEDPSTTKAKFYPRTLLSAPNVRITHPRHVAKLMARTISQCRRGELHFKIAQAIAMCAKVALDALERAGSYEEILKSGGKQFKRQVTVVLEEVPGASPPVGEKVIEASLGSAGPNPEPPSTQTS